MPEKRLLIWHQVPPFATLLILRRLETLKTNPVRDPDLWLRIALLSLASLAFYWIWSSVTFLNDNLLRCAHPHFQIQSVKWLKG